MGYPEGSAVGQPRLRASSRFVEADWLTPRLRPFGSGVAAVVPDGFPAYTRILHPARDKNGEHVRWAYVAQQSGGTMHRLVQFHALPSKVAVNAPEAGNLPPELLKTLCATLAEHTGTPDSCYFCLWHGYGWLHDRGGSHLVFTPIGTDVP